MNPVKNARMVLRDINEVVRSRKIAERKKSEEQLASEEEYQLSAQDLLADLLRFEGRFSDRIRGGFRSLESSRDPQVRSKAMNLHLGYSSSVLDIAISPGPEVALIDMVILIELSRRVMNAYVLNNFGKQGEPLLKAFQNSARDVWELASKYISAEQRQHLLEAIEKWQRVNPDQQDVISFRFSEILEAVKKSSFLREREKSAFPRLTKALATADQSRLLGERALYYAQRAPFLVRRHARASLSELFQGLRLETEEITLRKAMDRAGAVTISVLTYFGVRWMLNRLSSPSRGKMIDL